MDLVTYETVGDTWGSAFYFDISAPLIHVQFIEVGDVGQEPNGFLDPGESANLTLLACNDGASTAESLWVLLRTSSQYIEIEDSTSHFGDVPPLICFSNLLDSLVLTVSDSVPEGETAGFQFIFGTSGVYADTHEFELTIGGRQFLVCDLDLEVESGPGIYDALIEGGYKGQYAESFEYYRDRLDAFDVLFLTLGNPSLGLQEVDAQAILEYLEGGGNVYLEGVATWDSGGGSVDSLYEMFGAEWGFAYEAYDPFGAAGVYGGLTEGMNFGYEGDPVQYDAVVGLDPDAQYFLRGVTALSPFYGAAAYESGSYRTVGSSLEIGKFEDGNPPSTKAALLDTIMHFFEIFAGVEEGSLERPHTFFLGAARPNPSIGTVDLRFAVPERKPVSLKVYDVTGRIVCTLVDGELEPGIHGIRWSGDDDHGRQSGAGIYFVRLSSAQERATRKFVLLR
jgi:hypothetical protein